jgi:hypothetical protein
MRISQKTGNRLLSSGIGAVLLFIALVLQSSFSAHLREVQITVWSVIVVVMVVLINRKHYHEKWFWQALLLCLLIHAVVIFGSRASLPFSSIGVVILIGYAEAAILQLIFRALSSE